MHFPVFKIPDTKLLVVGNEIVQVTINYRWQVCYFLLVICIVIRLMFGFNRVFRNSDRDEALKNLYETSEEFQKNVQLGAIALVKCGFPRGLIRGPNFILHQSRKHWPLGEKYIFTRNATRLQASPHKHFFQLEIAHHSDPSRAPDMLEVIEVLQPVSATDKNPAS